MKTIYEVVVGHREGRKVFEVVVEPPDGRYVLVDKESLDLMLQGCNVLLENASDCVIAPMPKDLEGAIPDSFEIDGEHYWREGRLYIAQKQGVVQVRFITMDRAHEEGYL